MRNIDRIKKMWSDVYNKDLDPVSVIEKYFHVNYEQCINGVVMKRKEYIQHVLAQKKNMIINHIDYIHHMEKDQKLFVIYQPKGKNTDGENIEGEVISYFKFKDEKIFRIHGQARLSKGNYSDVDM